MCAYNLKQVEFAELEEEAILAYIASGEPMDKAGAYGIQVCHSLKQLLNHCWIFKYVPSASEY